MWRQWSCSAQRGARRGETDAVTQPQIQPDEPEANIGIQLRGVPVRQGRPFEWKENLWTKGDGWAQALGTLRRLAGRALRRAGGKDKYDERRRHAPQTGSRMANASCPWAGFIKAGRRVQYAVETGWEEAIYMQTVTERFLRYVQVDTQSVPDVTDRFPSSEKQEIWAHMLAQELLWGRTTCATT